VTADGAGSVEPRVLNGRFRLVYKLGGGGMGSVWLAEDQLLKRSVALKELMPRAGAPDLPARRARAVQEARAMARVRHQAIVPIHDVFFIDEDPWIVMEYISGRSLQDLITQQTLDERSIAQIGLHVVRGLAAVHRVNVVHRDVKPTNILVADDGSIFLVDFGIARIAGDASLTGQAIVGTLDFLAPERFRSGSTVGPPADIWALGVTFYYALEGYFPFWRDSERGWEATMNAILNEAPHGPASGGRLADITLRMLEKDPARRADADEVLAVLDGILGGEPPSSPLVPRSVPAPRITPAPGRSAAPPRQPDETARPPRGPGQEQQGGGWKRRRAAGPEHADPRWRAGGGPPLPPPAQQAGAWGRPHAAGGEQGQADNRRGLRYNEARETIKNVGIDTGVAMLLALTEEEAARILADCPAKLCGELLQGVAAARPATAAAILRILRSTAAGRAFAYLRPQTGASLVSSMQPAEALRILDNSDERTVAAVIMELPVATSATLLRSMYSRQRAAQVLTHVRPATAAELLRADSEFATAVLRHLSEPVRKQVSRHLTSAYEQRG